MYTVEPQHSAFQSRFALGSRNETLCEFPFFCEEKAQHLQKCPLGYQVQPPTTKTLTGK